MNDGFQTGVNVPTKVRRVALQNAASIAALLLTEAAIVEFKEKKPAAGYSHGGVDDMDY